MFDPGTHVIPSFDKASTCQVELPFRRETRTGRVLFRREARFAAEYRKLVGNRLAETAAVVRNGLK